MLNYFFDFDKTLADSGDVSVSALQRAFKNAHLEVPATDLVLSYMGIPAEVSVKEMASETLSDAQVQTICADFRSIYQAKEAATTTLYPGIADMLVALDARGKNLFIVSSKETAALKRNLKHLGILSRFKEVLGCDLVQHYKPAPDGVLLLLDRYTLDKATSLMIGDAKYDIQMGKAAGIQTCGATWGAFDVKGLQQEHPTFLIDQPKEILTIG